MALFFSILGIIKIALIFIAALALLVLVHEAGHFLAAKMVGMRVDEFGLGFPPRAFVLGKKGDTEYTLNWLPFGGFVRIYGEDAQAPGSSGEDSTRSFTSRSPLAQAFVLVAGVAMNMVLAWLFIFGALMVGTPTLLAVTNVFPHTPAAQAGIKAGDVIEGAVRSGASWTPASKDSFSYFVSHDAGEPITLSLIRAGEHRTLTVTPARGVLPQNPARYVIGVETAMSGTPPVSFLTTLTHSFEATTRVTQDTAAQLFHFLGRAFTLSANLSTVAGPIGIASVVGNAPSTGMGYFFFVLALISINLAIINILPLPALDGGRLALVAIETISRRKIKPQITNAINTVGIALIIILMVVVSIHDVSRLIG